MAAIAKAALACSSGRYAVLFVVKSEAAEHERECSHSLPMSRQRTSNAFLHEREIGKRFTLYYAQKLDPAT